MYVSSEIPLFSSFPRADSSIVYASQRRPNVADDFPYGY